MPAEVNNKISLISSMIDESFDASKASSLKLILQVSPNGILLAVNEKQKNRFIALEAYTFQNSYEPGAAASMLDHIKSSGKLLTPSYDSVSCIVVNPLSTLVPEAVYEADRKKLYLKFNAPLEGDELVSVDEIPVLEAKNVFALPLSLKIKVDSLFRNVSYRHYSSVLVNTLVSQSKNQPLKKVFVHVQSSHFEVLITEGRKLLFYNTFNYYSAEDLMYYLLFAFEQLQLNPEQADVTLLGEIERNSSVYLLLQKYVRNIAFSQRRDDADFSYQLQTIPGHFYFTLFNAVS